MFDLTFEPVNVNGRSFAVEVVRKDVRGSNARVRDGKVVITLPERMNRIRASLVARDLYKQISRGLAKRPERYLGVPKLSLSDGQTVLLLGRPFSINMVIDPHLVKASTRIRGSELMVTIPEIADGDKAVILSKLAKRALLHHMSSEVSAEVARWNSVHFNSEISSVRMRDMSWTWGSYSADNKRITLNFRLLFAPKEMLEYVIVHELAHSRARGHSRAFWKEVRRVMPDHRERRRWLRDHAHELGAARAATSTAAV